MTYKPLPSAQYLHELLRHEPETGFLFWKPRPITHFKSNLSCSMWNARYANKRAFATVNNSGYFFGCIDNNKYLTHRIIWKMLTGKDPVGIIDHADRNPLNNKQGNLRPATKSQNNINRKNNAGVHYDKSRGNWQAYTKTNGKKVHLGRYASEAEARVARINGVRELFGDFAP